MRWCIPRAQLQRHLRVLGVASGSVPSTMRNTTAVAAAATTPKGKRWETVKEWVMFSDLHVSVKSLDVCVSVLRKVKKEAAARKAGILFLGQYMNVMSYHL